MINLLPTNIRENLLYARRNTMLLRWLVAMLAALAGVAVIVVMGQLYINAQANSYTKQANDLREQLRVQKLEETQKRVTDISSSLKLVVQVLSREVLFSKLIQQIGAAIPPGTTLAQLQINKLQGGTDLKFNAANYQAATQIQVNLQDPKNQIFEKADIININCSSSSTADPRYPCQVTIRALFAKNNPFLFINQQGSKP
jgi:Tfp pilus assembly protein PilN